MWFKMILESFKNQTSKDDCLGYFAHQFKIRKGTYFYKQCQEHTTSLKEAFEAILANNSKLPDFPTPIIEQVYECEFVFGYDKKNELAFFNDDKIPLIEVKDFDNIIKSLDKAIKQCKGGLIRELKEEKSSQKPKSFKYKKINSGLTNLTDLMNRLKENKLIANDTGLADFRKVFSGDAIDEQVVWTGKISELSYFVKQLNNKLKLVEDLKQEIWTVAIYCFVDSNGEKYERKRLKWQSVPVTSSKMIDSLLNTLK